VQRLKGGEKAATISNGEGKKGKPVGGKRGNTKLKRGRLAVAKKREKQNPKMTQENNTTTEKAKGGTKGNNVNPREGRQARGK